MFVFLQAVEGVVGSVPQDAVSERPSSGGQYLAVRLTVEVQSPDQVGGWKPHARYTGGYTPCVESRDALFFTLT